MQKLLIYLRLTGQVLRHPYLTLATRLALGGMFIFAGAAKLGQLAEFATLVEAYRILPHSLAQIYGFTIPGVEVAVGIFLVAGLFLRLSASVSILATISFIIAKSVALSRGMNLTCGCFGETAVMLSSQTLALDFVLLALGFQILFRKGEFLALGPWLSSKGAESGESV
jgi:uncharacterized membrane protein YphA (DoxX/SURF4 family)